MEIRISGCDLFFLRIVFVCFVGAAAFASTNVAWSADAEDVPTEVSAELEADDSGEVEVSEEVQDAAEEQDVTPEEIVERRRDAAIMHEDPEAQRREKRETVPEELQEEPPVDFYGSVRLHAIDRGILLNENEFEQESGIQLGDGASRVGVRAQWQAGEKTWLFGRLEMGFNVLDVFSPKGSAGEGEEDQKLFPRLGYVGLDSDVVFATLGKNWSTYYQIAGMADRFAVFGGRAAGVYNAGTDGGATGTGRADGTLQTRLFLNIFKGLNIKPFKLNLQFQDGNDIPRVDDRQYGTQYGASAWLEHQNELGIGLAYNRAKIDDVDDPVIRAAGLTGDAEAFAVSFRTFGERWYASVVYARLENHETTDEFKYVDGKGWEAYGQWQFRDRWWVTGGGNWFFPDDDDPDAGEFEIREVILGIRRTFDSFNRMIYLEYNLNSSTQVSGEPVDDELTFGVRWDFGY